MKILGLLVAEDFGPSLRSGSSDDVAGETRQSLAMPGAVVAAILNVYGGGDRWRVSRYVELLVRVRVVIEVVEKRGCDRLR